MKCSNIPTMAELIALLMHMLEIHWLNAQLQAKCLWASGCCTALWRGVGWFGAHMEWYCMVLRGMRGCRVRPEAAPLLPTSCGFCRALEVLQKHSKSPQTGAEL